MADLRYCETCERLHDLEKEVCSSCRESVDRYERNLNHPSHRIRLGFERFNYQTLRREVLMADDGWVPLAEIPEYDQFGRRITGQSSSSGPGVKCNRSEPTDAEIDNLAVVLYAGLRDIPIDKAKIRIQELGGSKSQLIRAARAAFAHLMPVGQQMDARKMEAQLAVRMTLIQEQEQELTKLRKQLWLPTEVADHNYIGPTSEKDPVTGEKTAIPDVVHERFHGAVGDVMQGRVMGEARKQMQEALKNAPKEYTPPNLAGSKDDPRRIGWRV